MCANNCKHKSPVKTIDDLEETRTMYTNSKGTAFSSEAVARAVHSHLRHVMDGFTMFETENGRLCINTGLTKERPTQLALPMRSTCSELCECEGKNCSAVNTPA